MYRKIIQSAIQFIRTEPVLAVSCVLALVSMTQVPPDSGYADYINVRVIAILAGLMIVMTGLRNHGFFTLCAGRLLSKTRGAVSSAFVLVFLCFFFSMLITNDVALITFVPLTIELLGIMNRRDLCVRVVALQTIASNLGSMLTPVGNPQNLYLYELMGISFRQFVGFMAVPAALSAALLIAAVLLSVAACNGRHHMDDIEGSTFCGGRTADDDKPAKITALYIALFAVNVSAVLNLVPYYIAFAVTAVICGIADRKSLKIDYSLLATFAAFFIFIGNVGRIDFVADTLRQYVEGRELEAGIVISQFISNVPAAILLSGFTGNFRSLLYGVSAGGLGTLIASMANLISYKYIVRDSPSEAGSYIRVFTLQCMFFLVPLYIVMKVISGL